MRYILFSLSLAILVGTMAGCSVERDLENFGCSDNNDCLDGYNCVKPLDKDYGVCGSSAGPDVDCQDDDGDGYQGGTECPNQDGPLFDCNDSNMNIHPGAVELCALDSEGNEVDENCDGKTSVLADDSPITRLCPFQAGDCEGSVTTCENDVFPFCRAGIGYPPDYLAIEICDGIDNNCHGGIDEDANCCDSNSPTDGCVCQIGEVWACGLDTGECTRGVKVCVPNSEGSQQGSLSECVAAQIGNTCVDHVDCGEGAFCVNEEINHLEDLNDNCFEGTEEICASNPDEYPDGCPPKSEGCNRQVCRHLEGTVACANTSECSGEELCLEGFCQAPRIRAIGELCNGLDDSCNGHIDDDLDRYQICRRCPYNMALFQKDTNNSPSSFLCIDQYEASLFGFGDLSSETGRLYAVSEPGVIPHTNVSPDEAMDFCSTELYRNYFPSSFEHPIAAKRLCQTPEFEPACSGVPNSANDTVYPYGDEFVAGNCADASSFTEPQLTGSLATCGNVVGTSDEESIVFDSSGNVAEWVTGPGSLYYAIGGSFMDSEAAALTCNAVVPESDIDANAVPPNNGIVRTPDIGFRCCTVASQN